MLGQIYRAQPVDRRPTLLGFGGHLAARSGRRRLAQDQRPTVGRAQDKTSFNLSSKGSMDIGIAGGESTTTFGRDAESSSQEVKKAFRAVRDEIRNRVQVLMVG